MKYITQQLVVFAVGILMFAPIAKAQFSWEVVHPDHDEKFQYSFQALSCYGGTCTAVGFLIDSIGKQVQRMFWRSTDGGQTWVEQDPHLPSVDPTKKFTFTAIQQIDSMNAVAIGNNGVVVRTFDGGNSWILQNCGSLRALKAVHFSDTLTGIILAREDYGVISETGPVTIHTTTDGGRNWVNIPFTSFSPDSVILNNFSACHSYGNGKFRVFKADHGNVYTTLDNWKSIDSTQNIPDSLSYQFLDCKFTGGDTIVAFGGIYQLPTYKYFSGIIARSTDAGAHWEKTISFPNEIYGIYKMSPLTRDTVLAMGVSDNKILMSTDQGVSWRVDSLFLNMNYGETVPYGLEWSDSNLPLTISIK